MEEDRLMFKILLFLKKKFHVLCTTNRRITFARVETDREAISFRLQQVIGMTKQRDMC